MFQAVASIDILRGATESQAERELDAIRGEKVADSVKDDPRLSMVQADPDRGVEASNPSGTFEALMSGWGSPHRPAFDTRSVADQAD